MRPQLNVVGSPRKRKKSKIYCSWKCLTYSLAVGLVFALAVICYLLGKFLRTVDVDVGPFLKTNAKRSISESKCFFTPLVIVYSPGSDAGERISRSDIDHSMSKFELSSNKAVGEPLRPLPETFDVGDHVVADLPPGIFRHTSFNIQRNSFVQFNLSIEPQAKLVIYGRQTLPPSPTEHDFSQIIVGAKLHASPIVKRSAMKPHGYHYPDQVVCH